MKQRCVNCKRLTARVEPIVCCDSCVISLGERLLVDLVRDGFFDASAQAAAVMRPSLSWWQRLRVRLAT